MIKPKCQETALRIMVQSAIEKLERLPMNGNMSFNWPVGLGVNLGTSNERCRWRSRECHGAFTMKDMG